MKTIKTEYSYSTFTRNVQLKIDDFFVGVVYQDVTCDAGYEDEELDEYTCQNGKKLKAVYESKRKSKSDFESVITHYECEDCTDCPYKKSCTRVKGNRKMQVSKKFTEQRQASLERSTNITINYNKIAPVYNYTKNVYLKQMRN